MLFRAAQEQVIGAALAGLSCSQASRMSDGLGTGQRDALIRRVVIRATGVWPEGLLTWYGHIQARREPGAQSPADRRYAAVDGGVPGAGLAL
jgi:hypothetical protein